MADNSETTVQQLASLKSEEYSVEGAIGLESTVERLTNEENVIEHEDPVLISLVTKCVIESITDVELLKKCRLVNKYWNYEACDILRKLSITKLSNEFCNIEDFLSVLADGPTLSLPRPFKQVAVVVQPNVEGLEIFLTLIHRSGLEVKSLSISFQGHDVGNIAQFLKSKQTEIVELNFIECPSLAQLQKAFDHVRLSSLQTLTFDETDGSCFDENSSEFLRILIQSPPPFLSTLQIPKISDATGFQFFLNHLNLSRIKKLYLNLATNLPENCWHALTTAKLPFLKNLTIDYFFPPQQLYSFIKNASTSLECLQSYYWVVRGEPDIFFPKLKKLTIDDDTKPFHLRKLTHENFPRLETVKCERVYIDRDWMEIENFVPHDGIKKLSAKIYGFHKHYPFGQLIQNLKNKFPNVQDFQIDISRNWSEQVEPLLDLYQAYPLLRCLRLYTHGHLAILAGATITDLNVKWKVTNYPRRLSIMDFQELETLVIDSVSEEIIQHCLARIPNLKYLTLVLDEEYGSLSVDVFRDYLQHLIVLEFVFWEWNNAMSLFPKQLQRVMPRTMIKQSLYHFD